MEPQPLVEDGVEGLQLLGGEGGGGGWRCGEGGEGEVLVGDGRGGGVARGKGRDSRIAAEDVGLCKQGARQRGEGGAFREGVARLCAWKPPK